MRAITAPEDIHEIAKELKMSGQCIGLVPTMGALHEGHLALVKKSLEDNDVTIVSIFINPLQFNNSKDLANYPTSIEEDRELLQSLSVDFLFEPLTKRFYSQEPMITLSFGELEEAFEGSFRPGHFAGVGIAVNKLLNLIQPDRAYFGLKDLQQYVIIKKMVQDLSMPVEIIGVETVREASGLAMSSRNRRLSERGMKTGSHIFKGLLSAKKQILSKQNLSEVKSRLNAYYATVDSLEVEYVEIINPIDFKLAQEYVDGNEIAICFAGYVEGVRLIDNLYLRPHNSV